MTKIHELEIMILNNIQQLIKSMKFQKWFKSIKLSQGDLVIINNSVLYRSDVKTTKSQKYLGLKILNLDPLDYEVKVIQINRKISDFTHYSVKNKEIESIQTCDLSKGIEEELENLGKLVFILIGTLDANEKFEEIIDDSIFRKIILDPSNNNQLRVNGQEIIIKDLSDPEILWEQFVNVCKENPILPNPFPDDFVGKFSNAISELKKNSYVKLAIPTQTTSSSFCFLDQVVKSLKRNMTEYLASLDACANPNLDKTAYNDILRISYTFADEIMRFLRLFISISDLKPIIFWMTVHEQFQFSAGLEDLPWEKLGTKPELKSYVETIKNARNKAFHNLLQFNQTIDVQMGNIVIRPTKLRFFTEFSSKGNVFDYEDKVLIEILTEFTRAGEKYVSFDFWKRNFLVMEKTLSLIEAISTALKTLNN